jgi:hypothetical protein
MKYSEIIRKAEDSFLVSLEDFFTEIWGETNLPSHDLNHHRRVWEYSKEILEHGINFPVDPLFIRNLLISAYLHDIGMSEDPGIRHGMRSRVIAEKYLSVNKLIQSDYYNALDAIEHHDNKDYNLSTGSNIILEILSVADDLDAFGSTGISRYMEIYRARGIPKESIGYAILENAALRFENFKLFAEAGSDLFLRHLKRYSELREFFENYNLQAEIPKSGKEKTESDQHSSSSKR